jgi:hypothetical protein
MQPVRFAHERPSGLGPNELPGEWWWLSFNEGATLMTETKKYNGWTNYETWNVKLWMDNDQGSYSYYTELAQEVYDESEAEKSFTRDERAALDLADRLKDEYEEGMVALLERSKATASVWADLLGAALSEVNWYEIAEHYIEDCDKEEEAEEKDDD